MHARIHFRNDVQIYIYIDTKAEDGGGGLIEEPLPTLEPLFPMSNFKF